MSHRSGFREFYSAATCGPTLPRLFLAVLACALMLIPGPTASAATVATNPLERLTYLTEEYYPYNYTEDGKLKGISVDLLHMVWKELGIHPAAVESLPWARAYERLQNEPDTVLFTMARTPERDPLFRWAGPIDTVRFVLIARKDHRIQLDSLNDLAGLSVGTLRDDVSDTLLAPYRGIAHIQAVADMKQNISKLMNNRLDLVAYEENSWRKIAVRSGLSPDDFETVYVLRETPVYYAFHRDTPEALVAQFQCALERVKARPEYQRLFEDYLR